MYKNFFKRLFDFAVSLVAIIVLALPMLIIALLVKAEDGGPAIFKQERLGKKGKSFYIYKFRSMVLDAEKGGVYSDNKDPRITKIGNILRKTSLDELPQFFNILKGDMSFIGPRPPLTYHPWPVDEYTEEQFRMFDVRPGITGWVQVNGRKAVEWNRRIELNVWYVENVSLWLDIKILFLTFFKVLTNADNENIGATVKEKEIAKTKE
ncbi:MAG: sugar transferase [Clostridia bacterium]|nr:sugar transferase [Clostridia bacterium]